MRSTKTIGANNNVTLIHTKYKATYDTSSTILYNVVSTIATLDEKCSEVPFIRCPSSGNLIFAWGISIINFEGFIC